MTKALIKALAGFELPWWLLIGGFVCVLFGFYEIQDIANLKIVSLHTPNYAIVWLSVTFILTAATIYAIIKKAEINLDKNVKSKIEKNMTKTAESITGRRFANLIYIYARDKKAIAMAYHESANRHLPPGRRLDVHEMPHENALRIVKDQIGLELNFDDFISFSEINKREVFTVTSGAGQRTGETEICPSPRLDTA